MKRPAELDDADRRPTHDGRQWVVEDEYGHKRPATPHEAASAERAMRLMDQGMDEMHKAVQEAFAASKGALPPLPPPIDWNNLQGRRPDQQQTSERLAAYALGGALLMLAWMTILNLVLSR